MIKTAIESLCAALLCLCLALPLAAEQPGDGVRERRAAAERYLQTISLRELMTDLATGMAAGMPVQQRAPFVERMVEHVDYGRIRATMVAALVRHFTVSELDYLTRFMQAPEGKAVMKKMGAYTADVVPALDAVLRQNAGAR